MNKSFLATSALIGTIIGAGVLGIPYVVMRSGFGLGLLIMILVAIVMIIVMLYLGEISLRTKTKHHLTGYATLYLGKKGRILMFIAFAFGIYSALVAYMIAEGQSFSFIFFNNIEHTLFMGILFWIVLTAITFFGLKALKEGELIGVIIIFVMIISIAVYASNKIDISNLTYNNPSSFFVPFGVILFAFLGFTAIPEMERILGNEKYKTKKVIIWANIIVLILYAIFAAAVIGTKGAETPQLATLALGKAFIFLGIITMFTSYLALSIAFIDTLHFDFNFPKVEAWMYTSLIPLIAFVLLELFNLANFTRIISVGGIISGGLEVILILFIGKNAKIKGTSKPEYSIPYSNVLTFLLIIIFSLGAILEVINVVKG